MRMRENEKFQKNQPENDVLYFEVHTGICGNTIHPTYIGKENPQQGNSKWQEDHANSQSLKHGKSGKCLRSRQRFALSCSSHKHRYSAKNRPSSTEHDATNLKLLELEDRCHFYDPCSHDWCRVVFFPCVKFDGFHSLYNLNERQVSIKSCWIITWLKRNCTQRGVEL